MESVNGNQVSMEDKLAARFAELEEKIKNMPQEEQDRVRDAYTYAKEHHDGQLRKDGSPYITHPLEVAHLVADLGWTPTPSSPPCSTTPSRTPTPPMRRSPSALASPWRTWWRA